MFQYLNNIIKRIRTNNCKIPKTWNAALASLLLSYVKGDLLFQLMRINNDDGLTMLRKIKHICVPSTPQDRNAIHTKFWTMKMKEDVRE